MPYESKQQILTVACGALTLRVTKKQGMYVAEQLSFALLQSPKAFSKELKFKTTTVEKVAW